MAGLFANGHIIDVILVLIALEALALTLWRWRDGWPLALLCNLSSGAALMLALRAALTGADWIAIAGCLGASGLAHVTEMALRLSGVDGARRDSQLARHPQSASPDR